MSMFDKSENDTINERVLFKGKPNFFFACKTIFLLAMVLGCISFLAPIILSFVGEIQVYLVSLINLPLTSYTSLIFIIIYILIIIWILWIFLKWKATEYVITNYRIILKEGVLIRKSHHMPFNHIQDITVSQGIIHKLVSVGHVTVVNAYDLTDIELKDIHYPEDIQELIFNEMNKEFESSYYHNQDTFRASNDRSHFREDSYYPPPNQFNESQHDFNFEDNYNRQIQNDNEQEFYPEHFNQKSSHPRNTDLNNNDFLDNSIDEVMANLDRNKHSNNEMDRNQPSYNEKLEDDYNLSKKDYNRLNNENYLSKNDNDPNKNHEDENLSLIDIYSKKFKKYRK